MALPKEPRQLMINLMYLVLTALLAMNVSKEIINAFSMVDNSIVQSNSNIDGKNMSTLANFGEVLKKKMNPEKKKKVLAAQAIAEQAEVLTKNVTTELDKLRAEIIKRAGGINAETGKIEKEDDLEAATSLMITEKEGDRMKQLLEKYKTDMGALIDGMPENMRITDAGDSYAKRLPVNFQERNNGKTWAANNFEMVPAVAAITIVDKFKNDVKNSQSSVLDELWASAMGEIKQKAILFKKFGVLASADNAYVLPGQKVKITAMMGAYNDGKDGLKISINGSGQAVKEGMATYTTTAGKLGENKVRITAQYYDKNANSGLGAWKTAAPATVSYYVGAPQATVSADKMNVFFKGVDNPITVTASGVQMENLSVTAGSGVTLRKDPSGVGKYFVKVNKFGKEKISLKGRLSDGTVKDFGTKEFRLMRIPDPVPQVAGREGGTMPVNEMQQQLGVIAKLKNFYYDTKFNVVSYTLVHVPKRGEMPPPVAVNNKYLNHPKGKPAVKQILKTLKVGDRLIFEDIRAVGPDGEKRKLPSLSYSFPN